MRTVDLLLLVLPLTTAEIPDPPPVLERYATTTSDPPPVRSVGSWQQPLSAALPPIVPTYTPNPTTLVYRTTGAASGVAANAPFTGPVGYYTTPHTTAPLAAVYNVTPQAAEPVFRHTLIPATVVGPLGGIRLAGCSSYG